MATLKRLTGGRAWAARLAVLVALGALVALIVAIVPVLADPGEVIPFETDVGVLAIEENLGGQPNDCFAIGLTGPGIFDFRVDNPTDGVTYTDFQSTVPGGVSFTIDIGKTGRNEFLGFDADAASVLSVVVKGGNNSAHFNYITPAAGSTYGGGAVSADGGLHAPEQRAGKLYSVSHTTFCYVTVGTISGHKWHDNDADGTQDDTFEDDLEFWVITAYNDAGASVGFDITDPDGDYEITDVPLGVHYRVCEDEMPTGQTAEFSWAQSVLSATSWDPDACTGGDLASEGLEDGGHEFDMNADAPGIDFGNHLEVTLQCGESATLSGETPGDPESTVTLPSGANGCTTVDYTSSFDLGQSEDGDEWDQFVEFSGDPSVVFDEFSPTITQTINWNEEVAVHTDVLLDPDGVPCSPAGPTCTLVQVLLVPTTLVRLAGGNLVPVEFCDPGEPVFGGRTDCLFTQDIDLGDSVTPGFMQVTEVYKFLGDPPRFR